MRETPRIATMGLPKEVWQVYIVSPGAQLEVHGFYDRDKAVAYQQAGPDRFLKTYPLTIEDA